MNALLMLASLESTWTRMALAKFAMFILIQLLMVKIALLVN
jgi:hypothetical protein